VASAARHDATTRSIAFRPASESPIFKLTAGLGCEVGTLGLAAQYDNALAASLASPVMIASPVSENRKEHQETNKPIGQCGPETRERSEGLDSLSAKKCTALREYRLVHLRRTLANNHSADAVLAAFFHNLLDRLRGQSVSSPDRYRWASSITIKRGRSISAFRLLPTPK